MSSGKALSRFHQPIAVPARRLLKGVPLKFVAKKVSGHGAKSLNHDIPLIPFIDFLLCIVLFLLASFSASGELPVDKDKINVDFTSANGDKTELYRVMNSGECATHPQGWFYDNPAAPTKILICPAACQSFGAGQLDIVLGCGSRPPPL